jgi:hypothetical protein
MAGRGELRHVPCGVYSATFGGSWQVFSDESPQIENQVHSYEKFYIADFEHP